MLKLLKRKIFLLCPFNFTNSANSVTTFCFPPFYIFLTCAHHGLVSAYYFLLFIHLDSHFQLIGNKTQIYQCIHFFFGLCKVYTRKGMYRIRTLTKDVQERIINKTGLITFSALRQTELQNLFTVLLTYDGKLLKNIFLSLLLIFYLAI